MFGKYVVLDLIKAKKSIDTQSFYAPVNVAYLGLICKGFLGYLEQDCVFNQQWPAKC